MFWRLFAVNAAVLTAGGVALIVAAGPLHENVAVIDRVLVLTGLVVMLAVNGLLLRRMLLPLERLTEQMESADILRAGQRLPIVSPGEIGRLERTFNTMLGRLAKERRDAGAHALRAQEAERERLARGLHDEIGQSMTAVLLQLARLSSGASPGQKAQLEEAQSVVKTSLEEVRRLAQELRPETLDHLGLTSALENLATTFQQRAHVRVRHTLQPGPVPLDPSVELVIYRVAQESLTNVARHAEATEVLLSLESDRDSVVLRVVDNGRGFAAGAVEGGGLRGIRERALIVNGAAAIKPGPTGGVEVRLAVPAGAG